MSKVICVFCGEEPKHKSKEHIFPQWLLKMTGSNKSKVSIGSNWSTGNRYTLIGCHILCLPVKIAIVHLEKSKER